GVEGTVFSMRRVVEEVPNVVEVVIGTRRIGWIVEVVKTGELATEFDRVVCLHLSGYIFVGVGPLIEVGGARKSKGLEGIGGVSGVEAADGVDGILGQAEGGLGVARYFVKTPARGVGSCLVEQRS